MVGSKVWSKGWCGVNAKRGRLGGQGRCEPRIKLIVKMQKQSRRAVGDKGGCVRRIGGGPVGGVRVDVYEELKLL